MRFFYALPILAFAGQLSAQSSSDTAAVRNIVQNETDTFQGIFRNSTLKQDITSLVFVRPDVAIVETLTAVTVAALSPVGIAVDDKGRIRTRLLQVVAREGGVWKIVSYHNVDVKTGTPVPEPR